MNIKKFAIFCFAISIATSSTHAQAVKGSIENDTLSIWSSSDLKIGTPTNSSRSTASKEPVTPAEAYPIYSPGENRSFAASRNAPVTLPCTSPNATSTRVLAPANAPGAITDVFGNPYLCQVRTSNTDNSNPDTLGDTTQEAPPEPIILTINDLQELGLAPSTIHQERAPHTLINYNTNFWTNPNPQEFTTEINGTPVQARATPISYIFNYGDGTTLYRTTPGYQLGEDVWDQPTDTSHQYQETGDYQFTLTTHYRGEYSVDGGPWQVMTGVGEATTAPETVRVWRTKVRLVADTCEENPTTWGC